MSTDPAAVPDTVVLDCLDFVLEIPCDFSTHQANHVAAEHASWMITITCAGCDETNRGIALCDSGRARMISGASCIRHRCGFRGLWDQMVSECAPLVEAGRP